MKLYFILKLEMTFVKTALKLYIHERLNWFLVIHQQKFGLDIKEKAMSNPNILLGFSLAHMTRGSSFSGSCSLKDDQG